MAQYIRITKGSAGEIKYQLSLLKGLKYTPKHKYSILIPVYERVPRMLSKLPKYLE